MPSSNWRLIRTDGETAGLAPDTPTAAPIASTAAATLDSATVLRGQSHAGGRRTGQGGSAQAPSGVPAPVAPAGVDQFVLAEEAQRIQRDRDQQEHDHAGEDHQTADRDADGRRPWEEQPAAEQNDRQSEHQILPCQHADARGGAHHQRQRKADQRGFGATPKRLTRTG